MTIASIDPSIANAGHAVLQDGRLISYGHQPLRLHHQVSALVDVLASHHPDLVVIEAGYVSVNARTGLQLAELRGALTFALRSRGIEVEHIQPSAWRKTTICPPAKAKRKALKQLAIDHVQRVYRLQVTADEADAICLAEHAQTQSQSSLSSERRSHESRKVSPPPSRT